MELIFSIYPYTHHIVINNNTQNQIYTCTKFSPYYFHTIFSSLFLSTVQYSHHLYPWYLPVLPLHRKNSLLPALGQFTRNYTQTVKRAADNKRRYAPGWVHSTCLLRGFPKGAAPHLAHDFAEQSVVCYTLCRRCPENTVAAGEGKGI